MVQTMPVQFVVLRDFCTLLNFSVAFLNRLRLLVDPALVSSGELKSGGEVKAACGASVFK